MKKKLNRIGVYIYDFLTDQFDDDIDSVRDELKKSKSMFVRNTNDLKQSVEKLIFDTQVRLVNIGKIIKGQNLFTGTTQDDFFHFNVDSLNFH